jgi:predicted  nucleic acid-binding Zn-ribbon protein
MFRKDGGCPHCGDRKFNKIKFADSFHKKLPIDTPEHIKNAWDMIHDKRHSEKYTEEEIKMMEKKILNAWIRHINVEGPPQRML